MLSTDDMLDAIAAAMSPEKPVLGKRLAVLAVSAWRTASSEAALVAWLDRLEYTTSGWSAKSIACSEMPPWSLSRRTPTS
ncbi:hypothetical protein ACQ86E_19545 [Bradyrhizobium betae]|uniref:hypothetical protein n=1 Tax=Bradyrhizobium betae TaxID=244734 RepID=UPI003D671A49